MLYNQNVNEIKMIILTLDGGLLDLNRLRYNYFHRTCQTYRQSITKEDFSLMLGNEKKMYEKSPVQDYISNDEFDRNVEKDLFEYAKLKQDVKKEGVEEFLHYCRQKNIKVAVYTTHKTKRAIQYLQLTDLYTKIDFLIGGDSKLKTLPDKQVLEVVCSKMAIEPKNTLVVANFESMVEAALELYTNIIYMPDLAPASPKMKSCVYKVVRNFLELMNVFLFSRYDNVEMFSPMLGMNANMDAETLLETKHKLEEKYRNDEQLSALVERTYDYFNEKLLKKAMNDFLENKEKLLFAFEDESDDDLDEDEIVEEELAEQDVLNEIEDEELEEDTVEEDIPDEPILKEEQEETVPQQTIIADAHDFFNKEQYVQPDEEEQEESLEDIVNQTFEKPKSSVFENGDIGDTFILSGATSYDPKRMNELMDIINGNLDEPEETREEIKQQKEQEEEVKKEAKFDRYVDIVYCFLLSVISVLIALVISVVSHDFLQGSSGFSRVIKMFMVVYLGIIDGIFGFIINGIHTILPFAPTYSRFLTNNALFSEMTVTAILCVIFNFVIFMLIRYLINTMKQKKKQDVQGEE